jgi:quercetin dioxygenase-like cupin family protein
VPEIKQTVEHLGSEAARRTRVAPGGAYAAHANDARPEIIVMLGGTLTETRNGQTVDYSASDVIAMHDHVVHALENRGRSDVEYIWVTARIAW